MKLIRNSEFQDIYTFFPQIDDPCGEFLNSPKIWAENSELVLSKGKNVWYILLKVQSGYNYNISTQEHFQSYIDGYSYFNGSLNIFVYDYLNYLNNEIANEVNYIYFFELNREKTNFDLCFEKTKYILLKIKLTSPNNGEEIKLYIDPIPASFEYDAHYITDWMGKTVQSTWSYTGKVNSFNSLLENDLVKIKNQAEFQNKLSFHASCEEASKYSETGQRLYIYGIPKYEKKLNYNSLHLDGNSGLYINQGFEQIPSFTENKTISAMILIKNAASEHFILTACNSSKQSSNNDFVNNLIYGVSIHRDGYIYVYGKRQKYTQQYQDYEYSYYNYYYCESPFFYKYNTWYHIAVTFNENNEEIKVYVNGEQLESKQRQDYEQDDYMWSNTSNTNGVAIGSLLGMYNENYNFNGNIHDVRIYNEVLDSETIALIYQTALNNR